MKPFFSIIIPFYNVETYIKDCIDSLKLQRYDDFEVILIDDGSQDNTYKIAAEEISGCKNFKIIRQENKGLSSARNKGLQVAAGKYVWFVDSDDWVSKDAMQTLADNLTEDVDFIGFSNYHYIESNGDLKDNIITKESGLISNYNIFNGQHAYEIAPWIYVFNRNFLNNKSITFREDIRLHEDEFFLSECLVKVDKLKFIQDQLYYHRIRQGSLMRTKNLLGKLYSFSELNKLYQLYKYDNSSLGYWDDKLYNLSVMFYRYYFTADKQEQMAAKEYFEIFKKTHLKPTGNDYGHVGLMKFLHNWCFPIFKYFFIK